MTIINKLTAIASYNLKLAKDGKHDQFLELNKADKESMHALYADKKISRKAFFLINASSYLLANLPHKKSKAAVLEQLLRSVL